MKSIRLLLPEDRIPVSVAGIQVSAVRSAMVRVFKRGERLPQLPDPDSTHGWSRRCAGLSVCSSVSCLLKTFLAILQQSYSPKPS
jgi:hypothetical protein